MYRRTAAIVLAIAGAFTPGLLHAQEDTREGVLERQRAERAKNLTAYEPGKLEKALLWVERVDPAARLAPHDGFYVQYGFRWRPTGAGVGVGAGWRHDVFHRNARVVVGGGITMRNYQMLMADFSTPYLLDNRLEFGVMARYRHNPQEDYWGLGPDSLQDDRVSYLAEYKDFEGRAILRPKPWLEGGTRFGYLGTSLDQGTDDRFPSIEEKFTDATAPGLAAQPDFSYAEVFGTIDYRDHEGNARDGGLYSLSLRKYSDRDFDAYNFSLFDVTLQQFVPIFDKKRVFAVQARLQSASADDNDGQQVPFYFKPTMGGGNTHRGFNDFRFRDDAVVYFNVEYRWEALTGLDMALFSDWGTVAPSVDQLTLARIENAYGIGFRVNTYKSVLLRFDIGLGGGEGVRYFFKFSKSF